jgi:anti-sigma factor (TIGR02949 family)
MSALDRVVAGLSCREVLHRLSPYLDGELASGDAAAVERHLAACDACARFGGHVGAVVQRLKGSLDSAAAMPADTRQRVRQEILARIATA